MEETKFDLFRTTDAVVDAFGFGYISWGPDSPFERWEIKYTQLRNDGNLNATAEIYQNPNHTQLVEGTANGRLDNSDTLFRLYPNQKLYYRWKNAAVGSRCTATVRGDLFIKGDRGGGR